MKYYLLFIVLNLAIILAYADFDDKGKLNIEKMQNNLGKVQGLLRKLDDTSDESDDDEELSEDESSGSEEEDNLPKNDTEPTNTKTPTGNRGSLVQLLGFNSFEAKREEPKITFRTFFTYINVRPARYVIIFIFIRVEEVLDLFKKKKEQLNLLIALLMKKIKISLMVEISDIIVRHQNQIILL